MKTKLTQSYAKTKTKTQEQKIYIHLSKEKIYTRRINF